ncbi:hypothetical protein HAX54_035924, partial [Datura stramonium]|nr:hypothetical protein [Datura stramonium]
VIERTNTVLEVVTHNKKTDMESITGRIHRDKNNNIEEKEDKEKDCGMDKQNEEPQEQEKEEIQGKNKKTRISKKKKKIPKKKDKLLFKTIATINYKRKNIQAGKDSQKENLAQENEEGDYHNRNDSDNRQEKISEEKQTAQTH